MSYDHLVAIAERAGSHFFSRDTMRFFNSHVSPSSVTPVWNPELGRPDHNLGYWFVTSERYDDDSPRLYSVRRGELVDYVRESDGRTCQRFDVETIGEFQQYETRNAAVKAMRELIAAERESVTA